MKTIKIFFISCIVIFNVFIQNTYVVIGSTLMTNQIGFNSSNKEQNVSNLFSGLNIYRIIIFFIKTLLSLVGLIFLIMLIWAGWKYLTSQGNEDEIKKSLSQIRSAIIGLIIITSAYILTAWITDSMGQVIKKNVPQSTYSGSS